MSGPTLGTLVLAWLVVGSAAANLCHNVWRYPTECQMPNCSYQIAWRYNKPQDAIDFIVSTGHPDRWTGIIFSNDANVSSSDGIFAWVEGNDYVMMDAFMPDFSRAVSDSKQSVTNISAHLLNGIATFKFTRKRDTGDQEDISFADDAKCPYLVFPVDGGTVDHKTRTITTDEHHPYISDRRVCIRACTTAPSSSSTSKPQVPFPSPSRTTTPTPPRLTATSAGSTTSTPTTTTTSSPTTPKPRLQATTTTTTTSRPQTTTPRPASSSTSRRPSTTTTSTTSTSTTTSTTTTTTQAPTTLRSSTRPAPTTTSARPPPSSSAAPAPSSSTTSTTTSPTTTTTSTTTSTTTTSTTERPVRETSASDNVASQSNGELVSNRAASFEQQQTTSTAQPVGANQQWCAGRWSYPLNCRFKTPAPIEVIQYLQAPTDASFNIKPLPLELSDCSYFAQWQYLESSDSIEFVIQTKTRNRWTGIGFSNGTKMANSDAIIGLIEEHTGRHFIMDTWLRDHVMPEIDKQQNINQQTFGKRENGTTTVRFRRPRLTGDPADFQFTDSSCAYFFFPTQGGSFNAISKRMHKHELVPFVSEHKICIRSCTAGRNSPASNTYTAASNELTKVQSEEQSGAPTPAVSSTSTTTATSTTSQKAPTGDDELVSPVAPNQSSNQPKQFLEQLSTPSSPPEKSLHSTTNPINLAPSNDLSAELDGTSSAPTSLYGQASAAPTQPNSNPFGRLAVFSEPSLRWLAGIGCVATLLAMIVFQACFTLYKNKQAYKENLYRQSGFKPNSYLHSTYLSQETGSLAQNYASTGSTNTNSNSSNTAITVNAGSSHQLTTPSKAGAAPAATGGAGAANSYRVHGASGQHHSHNRGHHEPHPLRPHHSHYRHAGHLHGQPAASGPGGAMARHRAHEGALASGHHAHHRALHEPAVHHVRAQHPHYRQPQGYAGHLHGGRGGQLLGDKLMHRLEDDDDLEEEEELDEELVEELEEDEEEELADEELDEEEFDNMLMDEEPFGHHANHPLGPHHPYHAQRANCHHSHQHPHSHGHDHGHSHAPHRPHRHRSPPSYTHQPAPSGYAGRVHARAQPPYGDPRNMHYEWPRLPELKRSGGGGTGGAGGH